MPGIAVTLTLPDHLDSISIINILMAVIREQDRIERTNAATKPKKVSNDIKALHDAVKAVQEADNPDDLYDANTALYDAVTAYLGVS